MRIHKFLSAVAVMLLLGVLLAADLVRSLRAVLPVQRLVLVGHGLRASLGEGSSQHETKVVTAQPSSTAQRTRALTGPAAPARHPCGTRQRLLTAASFRT